MLNIADADFPDLIEQAGYEPRPYSGRAMYGKECVAFATDDRAMAVAANLVEVADSQEQAADILRGMREDSMGLGRVYYWPRVERLRELNQI